MRIALLIFFLALAVSEGFAQEGAKTMQKAKRKMMGVQHVKGVQSIDVTGGITRYGTKYSLGYVRYFSDKVYGKAQLFYGMGKHDQSGLQFTTMGLNLYAAYKLFDINEVVYVNAIGGAVVANYQITAGEQDLGLNIPSTLKYGVMGGVETEIFLTRKWVFIMNFSQDLLVSGTYGSTKYAAQGGIRLNF